MSAAVVSDTTRIRLLDAASQAVATYGRHRLSLTDVAATARVSRPTLYRHFPSKNDLLLALADHEKMRFERGLADALRGLSGPDRLDRALLYIVEFQHEYPMRGLVVTEPTFMLEQLERALRTMAAPLASLLGELTPVTGPREHRPADLADLVVRTALSHFLIRGQEAQLLRQLRLVVGLTS
jgi:AcrR family transcriptional regulator